jgi:hypothetical protein
VVGPSQPRRRQPIAHARSQISVAESSALIPVAEQPNVADFRSRNYVLISRYEFYKLKLRGFPWNLLTVSCRHLARRLRQGRKSLICSVFLARFFTVATVLSARLKAWKACMHPSVNGVVRHGYVRPTRANSTLVQVDAW